MQTKSMGDHPVTKAELDSVLEEKFGTKLSPIYAKLDEHDLRLGRVEHKLDVVFEEVGKLREDVTDLKDRMINVEETLGSHTGYLIQIQNTIDIFADAYKINGAEIIKHGHRLDLIEARHKLPHSHD